MRAFFESLGDLFEWTFGFLPAAGPFINNLFIVIGFVFFFYWVGQMFKHQKAGER